MALFKERVTQRENFLRNLLEECSALQSARLAISGESVLSMKKSTIHIRFFRFVKGRFEFARIER